MLLWLLGGILLPQGSVEIWPHPSSFDKLRMLRMLDCAIFAYSIVRYFPTGCWMERYSPIGARLHVKPRQSTKRLEEHYSLELLVAAGDLGFG